MGHDPGRTEISRVGIEELSASFRTTLGPWDRAARYQYSAIGQGGGGVKRSLRCGNANAGEGTGRNMVNLRGSAGRGAANQDQFAVGQRRRAIASARVFHRTWIGKQTG